jgi:hypothetical protein
MGKKKNIRQDAAEDRGSARVTIRQDASQGRSSAKVRPQGEIDADLGFGVKNFHAGIKGLDLGSG